MIHLHRRARRGIQINHCSLAGAHCGHGHDHLDDHGGDAAAALWQERDGLIPTVVPLTFAQKHDAQMGKCNKDSGLG
jgi:hypothetical protein